MEKIITKWVFIAVAASVTVCTSLWLFDILTLEDTMQAISYSLIAIAMAGYFWWYSGDL